MSRLTGIRYRQSLIIQCRTFHLVILMAGMLMSCPAASGQWSSDLNSPLVIDGSGFPVDPEIIQSGGRYFFSWTYSYPYLRSLKALDFRGDFLWTRTTNFQTGDYIQAGMDVKWPNLFVDQESNCILGQLMQKKIGTGRYILLAKFGTAGEDCWTTGADLFRSGCVAEEFRLAIDQRNDIFLAVRWKEKTGGNTGLSIYKIRSDGETEWEISRFFYGDSTVYLDPAVTLLPDQKGGCFVLYETTNQIPSGSGASFIDSDLRVNSINSKGSIAWDRDVILYHRWGKFFYPRAIVGADGYLYCFWGSSAQKVHPDGYAVWDPEGVQLTDDYTVREPTLIENGTRGDIRVFYVSNDWSRYRVVGQCLTPDGTLQWGRSGLNLVDFPYGLWSGLFQLATYHDTTLIQYDDQDPADPESYRTNLVLVDVNGQKIWKEPKILFTQKDHNTAPGGIAKGYDHQFVVTWTLWKGAASRFFAQNIFTDGTIGTRSTIRIDQEANASPFKGYDPVSRSLIFEPFNEPIEYQIRTMNGQLLARGMAKNRVAVDGYTPGLYLVTLMKGDRVTETRKIVID